MSLLKTVPLVCLAAVLSVAQVLASPLPSDFRNFADEQEAFLIAQEKATPPEKLASLVGRDDYRNALRLVTFVKAVSPAQLESLRKLKVGEQFLTWVFSEPEVIDDFLNSGDVQSPKRALEILYLIFKSDDEKECVSNPTFRHLALAAALTCWNDNYQIVDHYQTVRRFQKMGQMHPTFDRLTTQEMRYIVTPDKMTADAIEYLIGQNNTLTDQYGGTCWYAAYSLNNIFSDSIHGPLYYRPWDHVYTRYESIHKVDGVCGSLSHFGAASAKAHGIPSTPGGQPGHCAYMVRHRDGRWHIHYNVGAYTGSHCQLFDGLHYYSSLDMVEDVFRDQESRAKSQWLLFQAEHLIDLATRSPLTIVPQHQTIYHGTWNKFPDVSQLTPALQRDVTDITSDVPNRSEFFAFVLTGEIVCTQAGEYTMEFASDDGAILFVGGKELINNDGLRGMNPAKTAKYKFTLGKTPFEIRYFQNGGAKGLALKLDVRKPSYDAAIENIFRAACAASPNNYDAWRAWGAWLRDTGQKDMTIWAKWSVGVASAMKDNEETAWNLLRQYAEPVIKESGTDYLMKFYRKMHQCLPESSRPTAERFDFYATLNEQGKNIKDDLPACKALFTALLDAHYGSKSNFSAVIRWGSDIFLKNAETAEAFVAAVNDVLERRGKSDGSQLGNFLRDAILTASRQGDLTIFEQLSDLQAKITPPPKGERFIKSKDKLLSGGGLLQTSSTSRYEDPTNYRRVIDDSQPASFHTENEKNPWAIVTLPGNADVSMIYLRNVCTQNNGRSVPIVVSVSEDKQNWTEVFRSDKADNEWVVDLSKKPMRAQYVKAERERDVKSDFFHLTKFQVYGKPLY
ncbi:MAG: PA14 domain-containing protein [Thermoguttaceae bacterium]